MSVRGESVTVATCQVPDVRQDPATALGWIRSFADQASAAGASLVCFPECFLQGYRTDPVLARRYAIGLQSDAWASILATLGPIQPMLVFGLIESDGPHLFNAAVVVQRGQLRGRYRKREILNGERVFDRGEESPVFNVAGLPFGINICADTRVAGHAAALAGSGARIVLCPANNMLPRATAETWKDRHNECRTERTRENAVWLMSSDVMGERDDRVSFGPPHRDAIVDGNGVELAGNTAGRFDGVGDNTPDWLEMGVPRHELGERVRHSDDGFAEVGAVDAGGAQQGAGTGHVPAVGDGA